LFLRRAEGLQSIGCKPFALCRKEECCSTRTKPRLLPRSIGQQPAASELLSDDPDNSRRVRDFQHVCHLSTFIVFLPVTVLHVDPAADHHRHLVEKPQASDVPDLCEQLRGVRVLVVDDEPDARALVKRLLEDCNAVVTAAASAAEAFELVQSTGPDVLVSDIGMAGEDGHSLIRRVRQLPENQGGGTPALALTAYARTEDRVRAIRAGYQMHLTKPVESVELVTMVASLAGKKTSH
jgi:CheY-like chemotaxis protein